MWQKSILHILKGGSAMKKIMFLSLIICLVSIGAAYAQNDHAALVIKDACFVAAGDLSNPCGVDLYSTHMVDVSTSGGMTQLTCHFILPEGCEPPAKLTSLRGIPCPIYTRQCGVINTTDSLALITPAGTAMVFCQFDKDEDCIP
jgi:hypothetical protein